MKKKQQPLNLKWLIDIFEATEPILNKEKELAPMDMIMNIMEMVDDSMASLKKRLCMPIIPTKQHIEISNAYIPLLCNATRTILAEYTSDAQAIYTLPDKEIDFLKKQFLAVLKYDIQDRDINDLFLNNFMITHFGCIIACVRRKKEIMKLKAGKEKLLNNKKP